MDSYDQFSEEEHLSQENHFICLKPNDIKTANMILLNVINSLNIKKKGGKQKGGGDKFDIVASILIAAVICSSTFGIMWASGWIMYTISSTSNIFNTKLYDVCFSEYNISSIKYILKGEIGNIIKSYIHSKNVHPILAKHLREKFGTYDNFIAFCFY